MRRTEYLLITLMTICIFAFLSACGKKSDNTAGVPVDPGVASTQMSYAYNQRPCSEQIIYSYNQIVRTCDNAYSRREHRHCLALAQTFLAQYPQINCSMQAYPGYSPQYRYKNISEEKVRNKMNRAN